MLLLELQVSVDMKDLASFSLAAIIFIELWENWKGEKVVERKRYEQ